MGSSDESDSDDGFDSCSDGGFEDARSALSDPPSWSGRGVDNDGSDDGSEDGFESPEEFEDARSVLSDLSSMSLNTHATAGTLPDADDLGLDDEDRLASSSEKSASGTRATADSDDRRGCKETNLDAGAAAGRLNADRAARKTRERRERMVRLELERDVSARDVVPSDRALFLEEGHEGADGVDGRADRRADGSRAHVRHVRRYTAPPKAPATTLDDEGLRKERAANGVPARKPIAPPPPPPTMTRTRGRGPFARTTRHGPRGPRFNPPVAGCHGTDRSSGATTASSNPSRRWTAGYRCSTAANPGPRSIRKRSRELQRTPENSRGRARAVAFDAIQRRIYRRPSQAQGLGRCGARQRSEPVSSFRPVVGVVPGPRRGVLRRRGRASHGASRREGGG